MTKAAKSWQSRMAQAQDQLAIDFVESISIDHRLYKYDIVGSIAHAQMLSEQYLITKTDFQQIKKGLNEIAQKIESGKFKFDKSCEDIHMVIEAALIKLIGEPAKKLHTGRSRNDQVALDMRLWMRDKIADLDDLLADLQRAFVTQAQKQGQIVMPSYTHLQRAQPILSGNYLLAFVEQFQRDRDRLQDALKRVNVCPLGAGAVAGSSLPLDRQRVAEILGFPAITRNSIDTIADRDFCVEFLFACATVAMHLSRFAEDWIIYCSQEFSFIRIADAFCTGSSMMPQKRNPDMCELIRGKTGQLYGNLIALMTMVKGQPLTYNRDMQEDKKQLFDAADTIEASITMATAIVAHTTFNAEKIQANLDAGFLDATALAEYLVNKGIPFRQAHQIVGKLVSQAETQNLSLAQLTLTELQQACDKIQPDVAQYLTAANVTKNYATAGAAGREQLNEQLKCWKKSLA
ncbi:MAG: argininosuccinate lyase [Sedimentisphaerales bacterium]|nr:argininosuccinate lyase [Sedimentisphaerales bacterium]